MPEKKPEKRVLPTARDLTKVLKDAPPGAWVALSPDERRILGTGNSMKAAALQAQFNGEENPILVKMPLEGEGMAAAIR